MAVSIQKHKTQSFLTWIIDNVRIIQINPIQLGLWLAMISILVFWGYR